MQTINISELQHNLNVYLEKVKDGDEIIVEDGNEMIARILPFEETDEEQVLVSQGFYDFAEKRISGRFLGYGRARSFDGESYRSDSQ